MPWSQSLTRPGKLASAAVEVQHLWRHKTVTEGILEPHREGRFLWLVKMGESQVQSVRRVSTGEELFIRLPNI